MTRKNLGRPGLSGLGDSGDLEMVRRMPSFLYGLVNKTGIHRHMVHELMCLDEMQRLVGEETEKSFIELVFNQFSDPEIVLICDDSFLMKGFAPTCKTSRGIVLHGQVIIARLVLAETETEIQNLTEDQYQTVIDELLEYVIP